MKIRILLCLLFLFVYKAYPIGSNDSTVAAIAVAPHDDILEYLLKNIETHWPSFQITEVRRFFTVTEKEDSLHFFERDIEAQEFQVLKKISSPEKALELKTDSEQLFALKNKNLASVEGGIKPGNFRFWKHFIKELLLSVFQLQYYFITGDTNVEQKKALFDAYMKFLLPQLRAFLNTHPPLNLVAEVHQILDAQYRAIEEGMLNKAADKEFFQHLEAVIGRMQLAMWIKYRTNPNFEANKASQAMQVKTVLSGEKRTVHAIIEAGDKSCSGSMTQFLLKTIIPQ